MTMPTLKQRIPLIMAELERRYPETGTALTFHDPLQLAIATILSAQCTDKRVNMVTPALFERFPTAQAFADANLSEIEELIKTTGFFRNKAKHIQGFCREILAKHNGEVPNELEVLVKLPGIGRKTANVVLGDAFGIPGITVDTHVGRLSYRMGLTKHRDPVKVEFALQKLIPQPEWTRFSHRLIFFGREVCDARKPKCESCPLESVCPKQGVQQANKQPRPRSTTALRTDSRTKKKPI